MDILFKFSLAISIPIVLFGVFYRLVLARRKTYNANRLTILSIYFVSLLICPLMTYFHPSVDSASTGISSNVTVSLQTFFDIPKLCAIIWIGGMVVCLLLTVRYAYRIFKIIRKSEKIRYKGKILCLSENFNGSPFSIVGYIVMNKADFGVDKEIILLHELGHVEMRHSLDNIVAQLITIYCWYNPAAWYLKRELKIIHEYQADKYVLKTGVEPKRYQMLLLRQVVTSRLSLIANDFNTNFLQNRILMMNSLGKVSKRMYCRYILLLPMIAFAGFIFTVPAIQAIMLPQKALAISQKQVSIHSVSLSDKEVPESQRPGIYVNGNHIEWDRLNDVPSDEIKQITIDKRENSIKIELK